MVVNGKSRCVDVERSFLSVLREDAEWTENIFFAHTAAADCNRRRLW